MYILKTKHVKIPTKIQTESLLQEETPKIGAMEGNKYSRIRLTQHRMLRQSGYSDIGFSVRWFIIMLPANTTIPI